MKKNVASAMQYSTRLKFANRRLKIFIRRSIVAFHQLSKQNNLISLNESWLDLLLPLPFIVSQYGNDFDGFHFFVKLITEFCSISTLRALNKRLFSNRLGESLRFLQILLKLHGPRAFRICLMISLNYSHRHDIFYKRHL